MSPAAPADPADPGDVTALPVRLVLTLSGEHDLATAGALRQRLADLLVRQPTASVALDLSAVTFLDCAGIAPLVELAHQLGERLELRAVSPRAELLLTASGLGDAHGPFTRTADGPARQPTR